MSASEKLQALAEPHWTDWNVDKFLSAYEQIVAVVETAENFPRVGHERDYWKRVADAVAALEEALA